MTDTLTVAPAIVPAGVYYLGDPCYTVPEEAWPSFTDALWSGGSPLVELNGGLAAIAYPTAYGDGVYRGSNGSTYPVDSGLLGLVPVTLNPDSPMIARGLVTVLWLPTAAECHVERGVLTFGHVSIDTIGVRV